MRRPRLLIAVAGLLAVLAGAGVWVYRSLWQVPEFYEQALAAPPAKAARASDECLERAAALASDVRRAGTWQATFTADQINGWLAVDLPRNFPHLLPSVLTDPRVAISPEHVQLACGYQDGRRRLVLSLEVEVFLSPPDCLALRLHKVRAGAVPLPRTKVLDEVGRAVKGSDLPIEWRETDGDPVALIHLTDAQADSKRLVRLESLTLEAGRIVVVGRTERAGSLNTGGGADDAEPPPLARRDAADGPRHDGRSGSAGQQ